MGNSSVRARRSLYRHGAICSRKLLFPRTQSDDWMLKCGSHHRDKRCRRRFPLWLKQAVHFSSQNSQFCATVPCTAVHFVIKWNSHISQAAFVHLCVIYWCHINKAYVSLCMEQLFAFFNKAQLQRISEQESSRNNMKALLSEMSNKALGFLSLFVSVEPSWSWGSQHCNFSLLITIFSKMGVFWDSFAAPVISDCYRQSEVKMMTAKLDCNSVSLLLEPNDHMLCRTRCTDKLISRWDQEQIIMTLY